MSKKKKKNLYVPMKLESEPKVEMNGVEFALQLPDDRCVGFLYVFETKTALRKYYGKNTEFIEIKEKSTHE